MSSKQLSKQTMIQTNASIKEPGICLFKARKLASGTKENNFGVTAVFR